MNFNLKNKNHVLFKTDFNFDFFSLNEKGNTELIVKTQMKCMCDISPGSAQLAKTISSEKQCWHRLEKYLNL